MSGLCLLPMLRQSLKKVYYQAAFAAKAGARLKYLQRNDLAVVLNLHRVSDQPSEYWPPLTPSVFEDLLKFLKSKFHVCDIRELRQVRSEKPVAVLSFDDGYYDFIEFALPILERHKVPANMNVIPQCAITGKPIWNVRLYDFLQSAPVAEINKLEVPGFTERLKGDGPVAKRRFGIALSRYLKNRPRRDREEILRSIEQRFESQDTTRMMSTDEIRQIADHVSLGAHSYSHESMAFEDDAFFQEDFQKCRGYFETELATELSIYAFPNGSYRPEQIEYLRENSVEKILLVDEKFADARSDVLPRLTIYGDSGAEVRMKGLGY